MNEKEESNFNKAFISQKLNKPFIVSVGKDGLDENINIEVTNDNYICVETFSNMVLESKINLVYSIYTKNYGDIVFKIDNDKTYPIFTYQRNYKVNIDSFNDYFSEINSYKSFRKRFIIIGCIFILVFAIITCVCIYKFFYYQTPRISLDKAPDDKLLLNDSSTRGPTTTKIENI